MRTSRLLGLSLALAVLFAHPVSAEPMGKASETATRLGAIAPAPTLVVVGQEQVRTELAILQSALEAYRGEHFYQYPSVQSLPELLALLKRTDDLDARFETTGTLLAFRADRNGYLIREGIEGTTLSIQPPERYNPFWAFLW